MALLWNIILKFLTINYACSKNITISAETLLPYDQGGKKWTNVFASYAESQSQYKEDNQGCALTLSLSQPQYDDICPLHELANLRKQVRVNKYFSKNFSLIKYLFLFILPIPNFVESK